MSENASRKASTPSKKLGVKFLDQRQLDSTFPDWRALIERIDEQREISRFAAENHCPTGQEHLPQMYDNVYAILGGRGSGKSSVLLTLREQLHRRSPQDIMLPIITPEVISGQECSILGWILAAAETAVEETERLIQSRGTPYLHTQQYAWLDDFFSDCQFKKKNNALRRRYQELFMQSVGHGADISGYPVEAAVYYKVEQSREQYQLIQDLNEFWRLLAETRAQANALPESGGEGGPCPEAGRERYPLIILTFDDIDLVPERSMELLTTTFQYLTAPNIVIILTAAELVLNEVIRLKMVERMIGSDSASLLQDFIPEDFGQSGGRRTPGGRRSPLEKMTEEFYNKVIPPSSRYYLHRYNTIEERRLYSYSSMVQSFAPPKDACSTPISDFLPGQIDRLLQSLRESFPDTYGDRKNFLLGKDGAFREAYLLMFGRKNRNIANGCLEIMNTVSRLQSIISARREWQLDGDSYREVLFALRHLLQALLLSNLELEEFSDRVDTLLRPRLDSHWIYVDYLAVWDFYQQARTAVQSGLPVTEYSPSGEPLNADAVRRSRVEQLGGLKRRLCPLMVTLFFIEGILGVLDSGGRDIHGYRELVSLLNADTEVKSASGSLLRIFPMHSATEAFLDRSYPVLEHAEQYVDMDLYELRRAHAYLLDTFGTAVAQGTAVSLLQSALKKGDREWAKTVLSTLSVCFSGITLVDWHLIRVSERAQRILELFAFGGQFNQSQKAAGLDFLSSRSITARAKELLNQFSGDMAGACPPAQGDLFTPADIFDGLWNEASREEKGTLQSFFDLFSERRRAEALQLTENRPIEQYLRAYAARHWQRLLEEDEEGREQTEKTEKLSEREELMILSHRIVRLFRQLLDRCTTILCDGTYLLLSASALEDIRLSLRHIDDYSHDLKRQKDALMAVIDRTLSSHAKQGEEAEKPIVIPSRSFVAYLYGLQEKLFTPDMKPRPIFLFYDRSDTQAYFELLQYINPIDKSPETAGPPPADNPAPPVYREVVSDLEALELLIPYYFAASAWIAQGTRYRSELLWAEEGATLEAVDKKLKALFDSLTLGSRPKPNKQLLALMAEAQKELAEQYYSRLEASYE